MLSLTEVDRKCGLAGVTVGVYRSGGNMTAL